MEEQLEIPKIIHFVWAGGDRLLPKDGIENISAWAKANPGFHVRLWVDTQTCNKSFEEMLGAYGKQFGALGVEVIKNEDLIDYPGQDTPVVICDLSEDLRHDIVVHEIDQLCPNYGASSDLIRYKVLYQYGGAYFDPTDVMCNKEQSLAKSNLFKHWDQHVLFVDHLSQVQEPTAEALQKFIIEKGQHVNQIGNDTFICTQRNPLMLKFFVQSIKNYMILDNKQLTGSHIVAAHAGAQQLTISRTGPVCVRNSILSCDPIKENDYYKVKLGDDVVTIHRVRDGKKLEEGGFCLTQPGNNTRNWINVNILDCSGSAKMGALARNKIMSTISFEWKNFKICRFDDHIATLSKSLRIPASEAAKFIIEQINSGDLLRNPINFFQINFSNKESIEFFQEVRHLWRPAVCASILNIDLNNLANLVMMETSFQPLLNNLGAISMLSEQKQCSPVKALHDEGDEKVSAVEQLVESALVYIENLVENVDLLPEQNVLPLFQMLMGPSPEEEVQEAQEGQIGVLTVLNEFCNLITDIKQGETALNPQRVQAIADRIGEIAGRLIEGMEQVELHEEVVQRDVGTPPGAGGVNK